MPIFPNIKVIFVHIPKSGGSTVTTVLKRDRFFGRQVNPRDPRDKNIDYISQYFDLLGADANDYFKFSFVRNPWDRFVSGYHYVCQRRPEITEVTEHGSFKEFAQALSQGPEKFLQIRYFQPQYLYLTDASGNMPLDFVGRFERFDDDLRKALKQIGMRRLVIRHRKQSKRTDYRDYYDQETRDIVGRVYARDIDVFNYAFEDGRHREKPGLFGRLGQS
ncbi:MULTISPECIES: sulfotransferase family protein [unclassified Ruegeria]|uniref:sulfotransferase family protein n=1 Tax=unclassified Ruegeria TaxID=2625375 RepID=UPI00148989E5|nr:MULTISPECIES: sulfotransferase family protein [unclassified Ruegeria]